MRSFVIQIKPFLFAETWSTPDTSWEKKLMHLEAPEIFRYVHSGSWLCPSVPYGNAFELVLNGQLHTANAVQKNINGVA